MSQLSNECLSYKNYIKTQIIISSLNTILTIKLPKFHVCPNYPWKLFQMTALNSPGKLFLSSKLILCSPHPCFMTSIMESYLTSKIVYNIQPILTLPYIYFASLCININLEGNCLMSKTLQLLYFWVTMYI